MSATIQDLTQALLTLQAVVGDLSVAVTALIAKTVQAPPAQDFTPEVELASSITNSAQTALNAAKDVTG